MPRARKVGRSQGSRGSQGPQCPRGPRRRTQMRTSLGLRGGAIGPGKALQQARRIPRGPQLRPLPLAARVAHDLRPTRPAWGALGHGVSRRPLVFRWCRAHHGSNTHGPHARWQQHAISYHAHTQMPDWNSKTPYSARSRSKIQPRKRRLSTRPWGAYPHPPAPAKPQKRIHCACLSLHVLPCGERR